jgi:hypothetical protein
MNYFAITFAVNAHSLCRFGLGLAFVQHQIDRALAQSHFSVSPNAAKVFPLFNPHSPDNALISARCAFATPHPLSRVIKDTKHRLLLRNVQSNTSAYPQLPDIPI